MAPGHGLKWHSSISEDDPKHAVPLEQILDLRRVPLPQVTEQRCQGCQADHRGGTEINMLEIIGVAWSALSKNWNKDYSQLSKKEDVMRSWWGIMSGPWFESTNKYSRGNAVWAFTFRRSGFVSYSIDLYSCIKHVLSANFMCTCR